MNADPKTKLPPREHAAMVREVYESRFKAKHHVGSEDEP